MRTKSATDKETVVIFPRSSTDEVIATPVRRVRELLGLNASAHEFSVVYGRYPGNDTEIAVLSRSMLQVLIDLASHVAVPPDVLEVVR